MRQCLVVDHTPLMEAGHVPRKGRVPNSVDQKKWDAGRDAIYPKDGARTVLRDRPTLPTRRAIQSPRQRRTLDPEAPVFIMDLDGGTPLSREDINGLIGGTARQLYDDERA